MEYATRAKSSNNRRQKFASCQRALFGRRLAVMKCLQQNSDKEAWANVSLRVLPSICGGTFFRSTLQRQENLAGRESVNPPTHRIFPRAKPSTPQGGYRRGVAGKLVTLLSKFLSVNCR